MLSRVSIQADGVCWSSCTNSWRQASCQGVLTGKKREQAQITRPAGSLYALYFREHATTTPPRVYRMGETCGTYQMRRSMMWSALYGRDFLLSNLLYNVPLYQNSSSLHARTPQRCYSCTAHILQSLSPLHRKCCMTRASLI